jgi:hypothetical protein
MEYVEAEDFDELDANDIIKQQIIILLYIFVHDTYMFRDKCHSDLHNANWKIKKSENSDKSDLYQLVIYDYGYIIDNTNTMQNFYQNMFYLIDLKNYDEISKHIYVFIENKDSLGLEYAEFRRILLEYIDQNEHKCSDLFVLLYNFIHEKNYIPFDQLFEVFISMILLKRYFRAYITPKALNTQCNDIIISKIMQLEFCKRHDIFHDVQQFMIDKYLNNPEFGKRFIYVNEFFEPNEANKTPIITMDI